MSSLLASQIHVKASLKCYCGANTQCCGENAHSEPGRQRLQFAGWAMKEQRVIVNFAHVQPNGWFLAEHYSSN